MGCDPLPSLVDEYYTTSQRLLSIIFLENNSQYLSLCEPMAIRLVFSKNMIGFFAFNSGMSARVRNQSKTYNRPRRLP